MYCGVDSHTYDSQAAPPQKKVEELVFYAKERRLLLGYDANSYHIGWGNKYKLESGELP